MSETKLREDICRFGRSLFERGLTPGSSGNISVKLDDGGKHILEQISKRATKAGKLVIIGYCDRHQIGNANAAATARAIAVRDELVRLGVSAKHVRIRHVTNVPDKHVVDIEF